MPFSPQILQRIHPATPLPRLALQPAAVAALQTIICDLRDAAPRPLIALFLGSDRTSAPLAAEALAQTLHRDLFRVDLRALASESLAETEKNLDQLFADADPRKSILFFDEADAIFGKRSEVKDAHDRFANIEIEYLLQRLQNFRGLAILGTTSVTNPHPGIHIRYTVHLPQTPPNHDAPAETTPAQASSPTPPQTQIQTQTPAQPPSSGYPA